MRCIFSTWAGGSLNCFQSLPSSGTKPPTNGWRTGRPAFQSSGACVRARIPSRDWFMKRAGVSAPGNRQPSPMMARGMFAEEVIAGSGA
jgi:hypothetical protein